MLELCKLVLEPTRPTGAYLPASPLQSTDRANAGKYTKRVPTSMRCSNWSNKSGTKASPYQTDPCFKCLELWIRHRFTEILSLKEQQKKKTTNPSMVPNVACRRSSSFSSSSSFCSALV